MTTTEDAVLARFLERAESRLLLEPPAALHEGTHLPLHGDHAHNIDKSGLIPPGGGKPAAVLVPIVDRPEGATVLFTRRSTALRNHSGQIAFPGGRIDDSDSGPLEAALREAQEEIGLNRSAIEPLGYLDLYLTGSGYRIAPVVGRVSPGFALVLNPDEVEDVFECPLAFLMNPANHLTEEREWRGSRRRAFAMPWQGHHIWGVTAGIVRQLYERIYG